MTTFLGVLLGFQADQIVTSGIGTWNGGETQDELGKERIKDEG